MTTTTTPLSPWQQAVGRRLAEALARGTTVHPPAHDGPAPDAQAPLRSPWRVPPRGAGVPSTAMQSLAREQARDPAGRAQAASLMARCLRHYREQIRPDDDEDDAGVALACFLAACMQAQEGLAVTPERWRAVHDWVQAWAGDDGAAGGPAWGTTPPAQQADFFERMACMAVAIGEWTVVASRQGEAAMRSARMFAASSLRAQLGLELPGLSAALAACSAAPRAGAAADPSWGDAELPKAPTTPGAGERL
jgi:hypothetical protein